MRAFENMLDKRNAMRTFEKLNSGRIIKDNSAGYEGSQPSN